jgi:CRISPR system Cascade subunit CasE
MYLSRLTLDPRHPLARRDLGDAYEMHRTLTRAFVDNASTPPQRFLWRLEPCFDGTVSSSLLVQSETLANWSVLDSFPGYALQVQGNKTVDVNQLVQAGQRYRFRLLANPTVTRDGKRHGLGKEEDQLAWLTRQGGKNGFTVMACLRASNERLQTRRGKSGDRVTLQTVLLEGTLQAVDTHALRLALCQGLGHGKALGLGLLSLAALA